MSVKIAVNTIGQIIGKDKREDGSRIKLSLKAKLWLVLATF